MTSVCTCYCKHEGNAARKKDNDIAVHNGNRHPATGVSKKSMVTNRICRDGRESCKNARRVKNQETPHTSRSAEEPPSNLVLSPETSTALENAEEIINNAKVQLMEVCAMSSFDSARRNRNTYSDEPPWDNEMEERLYVRELVASKFHGVCSSRLSETNGRATSARSEKHDSPRVTVRRIDLSAPKFRVSRRRRADWSSLGYGSDDRSRGGASPATRVPSKDAIGIANETTAARDRRRVSSARGTTCGIQIGPSVHIVDRELTRQNLEDVHISPDSSRAQSRANTATYSLRHDAIRNANDPEGAPRTRRVRLDTLQRGEPKSRPIIEDTIEAVPTNPASESGKDHERVRDSDSGQDDGQIESPKVRVYGRERKDRKPDSSRDPEGVSECLKNATASRGAVKFAVIGTDRNEKLGNKVRNESCEGIAPGGDTEFRRAEDGGIFYKRSTADCLRNDRKNIVDKIEAEEYRGDRSKPPSPPAGDISRKAGFPRRANIASSCREAESPMPYRTIDGHFSHTFNSHNGQDGLRDVAGENARRFFASDYTDVSRTEDNFDEIDLYRPCLDDLESILHSNDRKIERVVRAARNLSELLSGPEFATYKLDGEKRVPRDENPEELRDSSADRDDRCSSNEPTRSSIFETELRNEYLTASKIRQTDEDPRGANAGTGSSAFTRENGSRGVHSKNSVESSVFPASDASDDLSVLLSRDSGKAQRSAADARLTESSTDRSDVTTFSNLVPALSSTRTEAQMGRLREENTPGDDRRAESCFRFACKFPKRKISPEKEYIDGIFARLSRKDALRATDRLVAYILQDEKQSVERKIASALKESAITPATLRKLLDQLREAESIRDACQTETLDILENLPINVQDQTSDRGNANGEGTFSQNVSDSSAGTQAPAVDGLMAQQEGAREIDACEIERIAENSHELKSPDEHPVDFSECRETRGSGRSTARCESTQCSENNREGGTGRKVDVAETVSIDAENQTDEDINENELKKRETPARNVVRGSLIRAYATSVTIEGTILRRRNDTSDSGLIVDKFKDSKNSDKYFPASAAFPEVRESVRAAAHFEFARDTKNNSKGNSEAESLKQISDIHSNDDENPGENSERLPTKIASARSREEGEMEAADSVTALAVFQSKEDVNHERLEGGNSYDGVNKDQRADRIIGQTERTIKPRPDIKGEAVKEIGSERLRDVVASAGKKVLFASSEVSEIRNERVRTDASPVRSSTDESPTRADINLTHSSTREDTGFRRKTEISPRRIVVKGKSDPADNRSSDPPRGCIVPGGKSSGASSREAASRNRRISPGVAGENNATDTRNGEIRESMMTFAANVEKDRDGNGGLRKIARSDDGRQSAVDLTEGPRNYKIDVLSSSNSSVSSTLLDHDDRSSNGVSCANARTIDRITPEMSHSEGELYMPSSCSYSLGEVRVLRRRCDSMIEDNAMDRDSSVTVLVTRSMLTSLNDSTMSLLESSGRV